MKSAPTAKAVLLNESHPEIREAVHAALRFEGYEVAAASDLMEALGRLGLGVKLALILLDDMSRPKMSMYEEIRQLRRIPPFATVPIVLLSTGKAHSTLDVQSVLRKPFSLEALLAAVRESCR